MTRRKTAKATDDRVMIHEVELDDRNGGPVLTVRLSRLFSDAAEADKDFRAWVEAMKEQPGSLTVECLHELFHGIWGTWHGPRRSVRAVSGGCGEGVKR